MENITNNLSNYQLNRILDSFMPISKTAFNYLKKQDNFINELTTYISLNQFRRGYSKMYVLKNS